MQPYEDRILRRNGETWPRVRNPPGWSQTRSAICDATPWFQAYQGGCYLSPARGPETQYFRGLLISSFAGTRSYMDAEILITQLNGEQGNSLESAETQRRHRAMAESIRSHRLMGVIAERGSAGWTSQRPTGSTRNRYDGYQLFPVNNMPIRDDPEGHTGQTCWTLDFFLPVFMWAQRVPGRDGRIWCARFEKYHLDQQSWWANAAHGLPPSNAQRNFSIRANRETCPTCNKQSPRMYEELFICLDESCNDLWCENGSVIPQDRQLTYTKEFLQERKERPVADIHIPPLVEDFNAFWNDHWYVPSMQQNQQLTDNTILQRMSDLRRAFCCPYCGMFNRRVRWHQWHCRNTRCNAGNNMPFSVPGYPPILTVEQVSSIGRRNVLPDFTALRGYVQTHDLPLFTAHEYNLGSGCRLAYMSPKDGTNAIPGGSNYMFDQIQRLSNNGTIPLRRHGMHTPGGAALTGHFASNYGRNYVFSARASTITFDDPNCPDIIRHAVGVTNNWVAPFRRSVDNPANEMYLAGYFYEQEMHWHDDGETGLQELITTYTLGGQGNFKVCIKPCYQYGRLGKNSTGNTWIDEDPVIPGCYKERERQALNARRSNGELTNAQWLHEFKALMERRPTSGTHPVLLNLPVNHGTIICVYGANAQKYLEHAVGVESPLRFALTFRHITDAHNQNVDKDRLRRKIAYDLEYDPGEDWTNPSALESHTDRPNTPLPGLMEEDDGPPARRQRRDSSASVPPSLGDADPMDDVQLTGLGRTRSATRRGRTGSTPGPSSRSRSRPPPPPQPVSNTPSRAGSRNISRGPGRTGRPRGRQPASNASGASGTGSQPTGVKRSGRTRG